jgi:hypothetical protein
VTTDTSETLSLLANDGIRANNGTPHDYSRQELVCDLTGCTFFFDNHVSNTNKIRAIRAGLTTLLFAIREKTDFVDAYITIPDKFDCIHYKGASQVTTFQSRNAHLTYHGRPKRKKITGEIHVKNDGVDPFRGRADKTEAPVVSSRNIEVHPLPICRIELSEDVGSLTSSDEIANYFQIQTEKCHFNTIEVHLARRGYMQNLASVARIIPDEYSSLFIHTNMHAFYLGRVDRRPGRFPQALVLQTERFELIILATHEYKNARYETNSLRYFRTKDYFADLSSRNIIHHAGGFFVDQQSHMPAKEGARRLLSVGVRRKPGSTDVP